jgi:Trypsin-like peptidase domain
MDAVQRDEKVRKVNDLVMPHTIPLMLLPSIDSRPGDVITSGSGALIDTGSHKLLVTCHHVWMRFLDHRKSHRDAVIGMARGKEREIANVTELPVLDHSKELDVAILDMTNSDLLAGTTKRFATLPTWPPTRPEVGDLLVAMGFPGVERREVDDGKNLVFRSTTLIDDIVSVSERHIALADEDRAREILSIVEDELPEGFSFGGMSGCPAFVNRNAALEFAGIIYESNDDPSGIFYISHADLITAEGTIDWGRFPH